MQDIHTPNVRTYRLATQRDEMPPISCECHWVATSFRPAVFIHRIDPPIMGRKRVYEIHNVETYPEDDPLYKGEYSEVYLVCKNGLRDRLGHAKRIEGSWKLVSYTSRLIGRWTKQQKTYVSRETFCAEIIAASERHCGIRKLVVQFIMLLQRWTVQVREKMNAGIDRCGTHPKD